MHYLEWDLRGLLSPLQGLDGLGCHKYPSDKSLGYFQLSLWDFFDGADVSVRPQPRADGVHFSVGGR